MPRGQNLESEGEWNVNIQDHHRVDDAEREPDARG